MAEPERKVCPDCSKPFSSRAHMIRHQKSTHSKQRLFNCKWCYKAFYRSDTLRDHAVRCDQRSQRDPYATLPPENPGRKRHACNQCKLRKVSCNGETPCSRCVNSGLQCTKETSQASNPKPPPTDNDVKLTHLERASISVLLNRFDTRSEFVSAFPVSETPPGPNVLQKPHHFEQGIHQPNMNTQMEPQTGHPLNEDYLSLLDFNGNSVDVDGYFENLAWAFPFGLDSGHPNTVELWDVSDASKLEQRIFQLNQQLHKSLIHLKIANGSTETQQLMKAIAHFSPKTVRENVTLYFEHWHKHAPIIHKATLDINRCATPLLMGLYCLGGLYGKPDDNIQVKMVFDVIEYLCFDSDSIEWDPTPSDNFEEQKVNLEVVQGLYLVVVAQYFAGTQRSRRRAANQRFTSTISLARRLKFTLAHHTLRTINNRQDYAMWVKTESSIRTMNMLLLLDRGLSIFSNVPTRIEFSELDLQLPCQEAVFNSSSFDAVVYHVINAKPKMRVIEAFRTLVLASDTQNLQSGVVQRECLDPWDMQILIHALYGFVWHNLYANSIIQILEAPRTSLIATVKGALTKWMLWWNEMKATMSKCEWAKYGFHGYADLYWAMVKGLTHCAENKRTSTHEPMAADCPEVGTHVRMILDSLAS